MAATKPSCGMDHRGAGANKCTGKDKGRSTGYEHKSVEEIEVHTKVTLEKAKYKLKKDDDEVIACNNSSADILKKDDDEVIARNNSSADILKKDDDKVIASNNPSADTLKETRGEDAAAGIVDRAVQVGDFHLDSPSPAGIGLTTAKLKHPPCPPPPRAACDGDDKQPAAPGCNDCEHKNRTTIVVKGAKHRICKERGEIPHRVAKGKGEANKGTGKDQGRSKG